jgi:hypothetical protein
MKQDELIRLISEAFAHRVRPASVVYEGCPPTELYSDAFFFADKTASELTCEDLTTYCDAISGFSAAAFCYFLPGILIATVRENRPDLIIAGSIVQQLNRSNMPSSWDDFFSERWPKLSREECRAVQNWVLWLTECRPPVFEDNSLSRAFDTLELLANCDAVTPLASR